ncbi:GNAT family N-acetyltransferase [Pandoraea anapnoica]|nr:GNAT family N-acetyltransferase [Pandoraea anapnoica]
MGCTRRFVAYSAHILRQIAMDCSWAVSVVAVDAAGRGTGVGRSLMAYAEADARARGMTTLFLDARPDAIPLYERESYVLHPAPSMKKVLST